MLLVLALESFHAPLQLVDALEEPLHVHGRRVVLSAAPACKRARPAFGDLGELPAASAATLRPRMDGRRHALPVWHTLKIMPARASTLCPGERMPLPVPSWYRQVIDGVPLISARATTSA